MVVTGKCLLADSSASEFHTEPFSIVADLKDVYLS